MDEKERFELSARLIARHQSNGSLAAYPTKPFAQILRVYFNVKGELRKQQLFMVDNYLPQMGCFTSSLTWNLFFFF